MIQKDNVQTWPWALCIWPLNMSNSYVICMCEIFFLQLVAQLSGPTKHHDHPHHSTGDSMMSSHETVSEIQTNIFSFYGMRCGSWVRKYNMMASQNTFLAITQIQKGIMAQFNLIKPKKNENLGQIDSPYSNIQLIMNSVWAQWLHKHLIDITFWQLFKSGRGDHVSCNNQEEWSPAFIFSYLPITVSCLCCCVLCIHCLMALENEFF